MHSSNRPVDVYRKAVELAGGPGRFAMALVLNAEGSTPRKAGVKAVVDDTGRIFGTLGGGAVEAEAQRSAADACGSARPVVLEFNLDDASASDPGPICGGTLRILIDPTAAKDAACYAQAAEALRLRCKGVLLTTVRSGTPNEVAVEWFAEQAIPADAAFPGAEAIASCLAREAPRLFARPAERSHPRVEVFAEPVIPEPVLLIVGGGHIGQALARQAVEIGFDVTVLDDRPEFADPGLFPPGVAARCGGIAREVGGFPMADDTYVVIVTRGHQYDAEALAACIKAPAAYVGMIGSARKVALMRASFLESGLATEAQFNRVFTPVGLDIGAVTVPEIATSIAAQLVAVRRAGRNSTSARGMVAR